MSRKTGTGSLERIRRVVASSLRATSVCNKRGAAFRLLTSIENTEEEV